ncbi:hypothetical protein TBR22_A25090 [Luteitalea sp. TBR-22]|uniref:lysylphosphatidylglycerol synthase transmembrane domain-containing protein n=1 Tax=Luteitalea sp. TBR-22 TaxID=2802971 RepID=UPI001AFBD4A6|nr:lysylphosphatidylglycerol synthase transmembrane domain-containing protein [Luteitalea sp. TBR-22]BCS33282.1 hypothetical protein TBR22_A25090 [Luteitalea sp. TBR-22]
MTRWLGSVWVRGAITVAILAYLMRQVDAGAALGAMVRADPVALLVVAALVLLDRAVMIWRWLLLLRAQGSPITTGTAARIFLVSSFVGSFLPAGVGGDAARAYALGQRTAQRGAAVASVAVDRILGVVAIALMGALGVAVYARTHPDPQVQAVAVASAAAVFVGSGVAVWADRWIRWLPASWHDWTAVRLPLRIADSVAAYREQPRTLVAVFALSVLVQLLRILQAYGLGLGLNLAVPFSYYLVFMPVGLLMLLLPISVSGFGLPQVFMVWLLRPQGVPDELSLALSTLIVLSGLFGNLPGAWLYLRNR